MNDSNENNLSGRKCLYPGCEKRYLAAKGMCTTHYQRALYAVQKGKATWEKLEEEGKAKQVFRNGKKGWFEVKKEGKVLEREWSLVGQYFHSIGKESGEVEWQGRVIGRVEGGWYLVEIYDWGFGDMNHRRLIRVEEMGGWLFYEDGGAMKLSYEQGVAMEGGPYRKWKSST